eukprot:CAMPEP_0204534076 /NCGR_PEP_ID=MMETSP0661-20131031/12672_1 /ASSEMBLY_ACC=CAM_ASM_000606 /TAXON_ID=109239 /ORGANISM="Alexandrium margalefi, Strain AMGDE01CS-322" /LENGTH=347 /DNA_ID=CAMNT_0051540505 /DNA_START=28 /DNA_END=1068 /DNA_ORIENTATION=+
MTSSWSAASHARVLKVQAQDVLGSVLGQLVHDGILSLLLHERGDGEPAALLELCDGGVTFAGSDLAAVLEVVAVAVVDQHHEPGCGEVAVNPLHNGLDDLRLPATPQAVPLGGRLLEEQGLGGEDGLAHNFQARGVHRGARLHEVHDRVREAQAAGRLHGAGDDLDGRPGLALRREAVEEAPREVREGRDDALAHEDAGVRGVQGLGRLQAEPAFAEAEVLEDLHGRVLHAASADEGLLKHVIAGDAEVDIAFHDVGGDVRRRQEDELHRQLLAHGDVEPLRPVGIEAGALEELHHVLVDPPLLRHPKEHHVILHDARGQRAPAVRLHGSFRARAGRRWPGVGGGEE